MNNQQLFDLFKSIDASRDMVMKEIMKIDWQHIAINGCTILAIKAYREKHNCTLRESHDAVYDFLRSVS